jgi:hypothetical protein
MSNFDAARFNRQLPAFRAMDAGGEIQKLIDKTDDLDGAVDAVKGLQLHSVQQFFLIANQTTITPFVPNGVDGVLSDADYYRIAAPTSAGGTITAQFKDGNGVAVTEVLTIAAAAAGPFVLDEAGAFENGLFLHVVSNNGDATQGTGLRAAVVYTVTHPEA